MNETTARDILTFAGVLLFMIFLCTASYYSGKLEMERGAARAGHAEYYLDSKHSKQWRWLPVGDKETAP